MDKELVTDAILLRGLPAVGDVAYRLLVDHFGSPSAVFDAPSERLDSIEGLDPAAYQSLRRGPEASARMAVEVAINRLEAMGWAVLHLGDPRYPELLRAIHDPPAVLYVFGEYRSEDRRAVAIVGSRQSSAYGRETARRLATELAMRGVTVVSGLARGVDGAAHDGALEVGGRTIAVTGSGPDVIYPPEHENLAGRIALQGCIMTEFPLRTPPDAANFPRRNRLISGLSTGVVVVEAGERSGALITARLALEQGREVFAVPGMAQSRNSLGPHRLIRTGAKLVEGVDDILEEIEAQWADLKLPEMTKSVTKDRLPRGHRRDESRAMALGGEELSLYQLLSESPRHIDDVTAASQLPASQVAGLLLNLELKGAVRRLDGQRYQRLES